jgi:hypothetical protein
MSADKTDTLPSDGSLPNSERPGHGETEQTAETQHTAETPSGKRDQCLELPDAIPQAWLESIKKALKPSGTVLAVTTILSSSVMSAVLTFTLNYYQQKRTDERQAKLIIQTEKRGYYLTLDKDVQKFESDLASAVTTFRYALSHPEDKEFGSNFISDSIDTVSEQMAQLMTMKRGTDIDEETKKQLSAILNQLAPMLSAAQSDPKTLSKLIETYDTQLKQNVSNLENRIEQMKNFYALKSD